MCEGEIGQERLQKLQCHWSVLKGVNMVKSVPVSARLDPETLEGARELAQRSGRPLSSVVSELASEALRIRRHPGIAFAGPPGSRRARLEGTGLDVWEVIAAYRGCGEQADRTLQLLEHLSPRQMEAALRYQRAYPQEIDALIRDNQRPVEEWQRAYPHISRVVE